MRIIQQKGVCAVTDLHCHILPGVDDGASSLSDALQMASMAARSGVSAIVATPHCNLPHHERPNYLDADLLKRVAELRSAIEQARIPLRLYAGAEVFCTPGVEELLAQEKLLTLAGSRYLLAEFYFDESPEFMDYCLRAIARQGCIPVVAHPERYEATQASPATVERWFAEGYIIQLNKGSILGNLGRRAQLCADWILHRGLAHVVASDAHTPKVRTPHMYEILRYLEDLVGVEYSRILLSANPGRIVRDQSVIKP